MELLTGLLILLVLFVFHTLADFTFLQTPKMLKAKTDVSIWGILPHGAVHAVFVGLIIWVFGFTPEVALMAALIELVVHTAMDFTKGYVPKKFDVFKDMADWKFWAWFGFDQFVHIVTKLGIVAYIATA